MSLILCIFHCLIQVFVLNVINLYKYSRYLSHYLLIYAHIYFHALEKCIFLLNVMPIRLNLIEFN